MSRLSSDKSPLHARIARQKGLRATSSVQSAQAARDREVSFGGENNKKNKTQRRF
jgi:hypothetical protein